MGQSGTAGDQLAARVARLRAEVTALVSLDPAVDGTDGPALHAELRTAAGQLHAFAARILARVEADGRWAAGGSRTFPDWIARTTLTSTGAVRRDVTLGRALDGTLPRTALALASGQVSLEHAQVLAQAASSSPARQVALTSTTPGMDEAALLERARQIPLDRYRREVDAWAARADAAAAEAEHDAACAKEYLTLTRQHGGVALRGFLTSEHAQVLSVALRAVSGVPSAGDTRSREERQAAALVDAGRLILDRGLSGSGQQVRPHLIVHVPVQALRTVEQHGTADTARFDGLPPALLDDGTPVAPTTLARLACDGELSRVVFGAAGAVLDVGRAQRTYSGAQRLAVIARDGSCRYPGCGAPLALGEVHHVVPWAGGGRTSVANGVLLCWFHHALVHRRGIRIARIDGGWELRRSDGSLITTPGAADGPVGGPPPGAPPGHDEAVGRGRRHGREGPPGPAPGPWGGPPGRGRVAGAGATHAQDALPLQA